MAKRLLFVILVCILFANGQRNYSVDIKVSNIWYSGSGDDIYFQICNDNYMNSSNLTTTECLKFYQVEGMENRGEWYEFEYINQTDIGSITSMKLVTYNNDQLCVEKVRIDDTPYAKTGTTSYSCMEVSDTLPTGSCAVIDITFGSDSSVKNQPAEFASTTYETAESCQAAIDTSSDNVIIEPETPIVNGTRTYEISLTVSSYAYSGTTSDLYLRLCTDSGRTDCSQTCDSYYPNTNCVDDWFVFEGGADEEGDTYKGYWNTKDIGDAKYADIVIYGSDSFCLSRLDIDGTEANAGSYPECIDDNTANGMYIFSMSARIYKKTVYCIQNRLLDIIDRFSKLRF